MVSRKAVVKLKCDHCGNESNAMNDISDIELRARLERYGWRSAGSRDWCVDCAIAGKAKP